MIGENLQKAIYQKLKGSATLTAVVVGVYDDVPQSSDSGLASAFPYVTIGDDSSTEWDTDTELGVEVLITIHVWSRAKGRTETKQIQKIVYNLLHRCKLSVKDSVLVGCEYISDESFMDSDGKTRHGVQQFRVTLEG